MDRLEIDQTFIIEGQMLLHCGPIFFSSSDKMRPTDVFSNGTFGLVDTGERKLLVTCEHVWSEYLLESARNPNVQLAILLGTGQPIVLPQENFIASHASYDLATFAMENLLHLCHKRQFCRLSTKVAAQTKSKDVLATLGYLGEARSTSPAGADFRYHFIGASIADTSRWRFCADITKTKGFRDADGVEIKTGSPMGGLSGSPCYRLERFGKLSLIGFVTSTALGLLRLTNAACLAPDGRLKDLD